MLCGVVLATLAERFTERATTMKWGLKPRDCTWVDIILFADKYFLVATTAAMIESTTNARLALLGEHGGGKPQRQI